MQNQSINQSVGHLLYSAPTTIRARVHQYLRQFTSVADIPSRQRLRSSTSDDLCIPAVRLPTVGRRAFSVAGARVWNALLADVTSALSLFTFRKHLKSHLFPLSYPGLVLYINFFSLRGPCGSCLLLRPLVTSSRVNVTCSACILPRRLPCVLMKGAHLFRGRMCFVYGGEDTHGAAELLTCNNSLPGESISCGGGFLQAAILFRDTGSEFSPNITSLPLYAVNLPGFLPPSSHIHDDRGTRA